jgi:hypothetical protein
MPSRYVVVQYLPDPITDERINIGVAAFDDTSLHVRFLHDWRRVAAFSGRDIKFLRQFAAQLEDASSDKLPLWPNAEADARLLLEQAPQRWINSIQMTAPRASTKSARDLVEDVSRRFLRTQDRRWLAARAEDKVVTALADVGHAGYARYVQRNREIQGGIEPHNVDLLVGNGRPISLALALSFERQDFRSVQRDYGAAAWTIEDIKRRQPDVPIAVLMLPPVKGTSKTYGQAVHVFEELDARPVPEPELEDWAHDVARDVVGAEAA